MKKLKLEELEVKSLTTSIEDQSANEVKGGTTWACVATVIIVYGATMAMSTPAY